MILQHPVQRMAKWTWLLPAIVLLSVAGSSPAQEPPGIPPGSTEGRSDRSVQQEASRPWYERLRIRGYAQIRYNRLFETNRDFTCPQCDRSIGNNGGLFLRRGRLVVSGDVSDRISFYIQPDFATDAGGSQHYLQLRDAYFDLHVDHAKTHRLRFGLTKVPFGFENLQSSSNRLPLDRAEGLNSGVPGERDLGVFYHWTPANARRLFRFLADSGYKGTGDYGVVAVGVTNGQGANRSEANNSLHQVVRVSWPFALSGGQYIEAGAQAYNGRFVLLSRTPGVTAAPEYDDRRAGLSLTWYARPLGFAGEWNWGEGPEYDPATHAIETRDLRGGFAQTMLRVIAGPHVLQPFFRAQYYRGGRKSDLDARSLLAREYDAGIEWSPLTAFELTAQYSIGDRRVADGALTDFRREKGRLLRLQAQFSF